MTVRERLREAHVDDVVRVDVKHTIRACHRPARSGFLLGGSTGTVVSAAMTWPDMYQGYDLTAVAIAPDLGERHLDTVYQENWLRDLYGEDVLAAEGVTADPRPA